MARPKPAPWLLAAAALTAVVVAALVHRAGLATDDEAPSVGVVLPPPEALDEGDETGPGGTAANPTRSGTPAPTDVVPALPHLWEKASKRAALVRRGANAVVHVGPRGDLERLDAATGRRLWRLPAPPRRAWHRPSIVKDSIVLNARDMTAVADVATGRIRWRHESMEAERLRVAAGPAVSLQRGSDCAVRALDIRTGRAVTPWLGETHDDRAKPQVDMVSGCSEQVHIMMARAAIGVVAYGSGDEFFLGLWTSARDGAEPEVSQPLGRGLSSDVAHGPFDGVVEAHFEDALRVMRFSTRTGELLWSRALGAGEGADGSRVRRVPGPEQDALLAQRGSHVELLDPESGMPLWSLTVDGIAAVVGEAPIDQRAVLHSSGDRQGLAIQWITPAGELLTRHDLACVECDVFAVPSGILEIRTHTTPGSVVLFDRNGRQRYERFFELRGWRMAGELLVLHPRSANEFVLIDRATGRTVGRVTGAVRFLGRVTAHDGAAVLLFEKENQLFAVAEPQVEAPEPE